MTSRFLENLTLSSLIAPVAKEDFRKRYWEQKPLVVHREDPAYYEGLFSLDDFDDAIVREPSYVKVANAPVKKAKSYNSTVSPGLEQVLNEMREGGTLVLDQLHHKDPNLRMLCRALAPEFGHKFQTNLYLTPPNGQGFSPHWDNHDVFILQTLGSKNWKIEKNRRDFPEKGKTMEASDKERELRGDLLSFTLKQGDLIYIPRGYVHAAECGEEPSLHITLGVTASFLEDLLSAAIRAAVLRDERFRMALPLGFMSAPREQLVKQAMDAFLEIADETFLGGVVDQYRDELIRSYQLDVSGQVAAYFRPVPLSLDTKIAPRPGIAYQWHDESGSVRLNFGSRTIIFPDFFGEALKFALKTTTFAVRDLPGDLEDQERIVFIERLLQEGLVVRK